MQASRPHHEIRPLLDALNSGIGMPHVRDKNPFRRGGETPPLRTLEKQKTPGFRRGSFAQCGRQELNLHVREDTRTVILGSK